MKSKIKKAITSFDLQLSMLLKNRSEKKGSVIVILIHSILQNRSDYFENSHCDPQQRLTQQDLKIFAEILLKKGYQFITLTELDGNLDKKNNYAIITFDDGYYNNVNVLPLLEEYKIPATFYVSINHILQNKMYWWDSIYSNARKNGKDGSFIAAEQTKLKKLKNEQIESYILENYGNESLMPTSDNNRPFNEKELKDFAKHKFVKIGNHTMNHALLTNYPIEEAEKEIVGAQDKINEVVGYFPDTFAYPNGYFNNETLSLVQKLGFKTATTIEQGKSYLPVQPYSFDAMKIPRFILWGNKITQQAHYYRTDKHLLKNVRYYFGF